MLAFVLELMTIEGGFAGDGKVVDARKLVCGSEWDSLGCACAVLERRGWKRSPASDERMGIVFGGLSSLFGSVCSSAATGLVLFLAK